MPIGAVLAPIAVLVLAARRHERRRREAFTRMAGELGLTHSPKFEDLLEQPIARFYLFQHGHARSRQGASLLRGRIEDIDVLLFDYRYTTGGGQHAATLRHAVAALGIAGRRLPSFELRPENVFHRIGSAFGYQDIDLAAFPWFSHRYLLRGEDEAAVRRLFEAAMAKWLEPRDKLCIEGGGEWLIVYRENTRLRPERLPQLLEEAFEVSSHLGRGEAPGPGGGAEKDDRS